jgi:hypothetical protein
MATDVDHHANIPTSTGTIPRDIAAESKAYAFERSLMAETCRKAGDAISWQ